MTNAEPVEVSRSGWGRERTAKTAILGLLAVSVLSAVLIASGWLSEDVAFDFSSIIYVVVPSGAGVIVMGAAMKLAGKTKAAWLAIGAGVLAWGIGEFIWILYEYFLQTEVPYPGWADVFYVLGYPLMFVGVLLLPHVKPRRLERIRLSIDAVAGSVALAAIMWVAYLGDQIYLDPEIGFLEQFINIMYAFGDAILLIALMILAGRRSSLRFDVRLLALAAGMIFTAAADVIYVLQVEADTYLSGGWVDSLWLISYGAFIATGWYLLQPGKESEQVDRSARLWQLITPYSAILLLFGLTLRDIGGDASVLQISSGIVGLLIIGRQGVAIRENRELVEKQRDDLIASISHELRTPLTAVQGFAQLLKERGEQMDSRRRVELVEIIDQQSRHLGAIVTDLVDVARDRLSKTDLQIESLDLGRVITDSRNMLPESIDAKIELNMQVEPGLCVSGDRRRVTQVLVNLFTNAIRYGRGLVEVQAFARDGRVIVAVHDNGLGVPKRYEEAIWERFERGAHRLDSTIPGSGIGLPIARSLVQAHQGTIEYQTSDRLGGACFTVSLPRQTVATEHAPEQILSTA